MLDYGDDWQHEWDVHFNTFVHPVHSEDYKVAWDYDNGEEQYIIKSAIADGKFVRNDYRGISSNSAEAVQLGPMDHTNQDHW